MVTLRTAPYAALDHRLSEEVIVKKLALVAFVVTISALSSGCLMHTTESHSTPFSVNPRMQSTLSPKASFEILGIARAERCQMTANQSFMSPAGPNPNPATLRPALYQAAKFDAIDSIKGADNLMMVRSRFTRHGTKECVLVVGRAYRVLRHDASNRPRPSSAPVAASAPSK